MRTRREVQARAAARQAAQQAEQAALLERQQRELECRHFRWLWVQICSTMISLPDAAF